LIRRALSTWSDANVLSEPTLPALDLKVVEWTIVDPFAA
jgi:hypothetical protein